MEFDQIHYACLQCGKSCRQDWDIWLRPERVRENYLELFVQQDSPFEAAGDGWRVRRPEGVCASLDGESRCRIHSELSYEHKPYGCQQYPVLLVRSPDGVRVSASYTCTAVLEEHGPPLAQLREQVPAWLDDRFFVVEVGSGLPWDEVKALEAHFEELLREGSWESALRRILSGLYLGFCEQWPGHPCSWWRNDRRVALEWEQSLSVILSALLKPCFGWRDREKWERFDRNFVNHQVIHLEQFGYRGSAAELLEWASHPENSPDLERYRRSLWFRRQHLRCGGILSGFLMLWSVGPLYRVLSRLSGSHSALERIELNLLGHSSVSEQIFPVLGRYWLEQTGVLGQPGGRAAKYRDA